MDVKKYTELCNKREIIMHELRMKNIPYSERLEAVKNISDEILKVTDFKTYERLKKEGRDYNREYIELWKKVEQTDDENEKEQLKSEMCGLLHQDSFELNKSYPIFKLLGVLDNGKVNGKKKFKRLLIQKIGEKKYLDNNTIEYLIYDEKLKATNKDKE